MLILFKNNRHKSGLTSGPALNKHRPKIGSGLYVDLENLQVNGKQLLETLINEWPESTPKPVRIMLTVRADFVELWRLWAVNRFDSLDVVVKGTQHFSASKSKNSADIALATSAMADWLLRRVSHIAVFSDDSDFVSLYASIRDEMVRSGVGDRDVPFLWVVTNRNGTLSPIANQFFPSDKLHVVRTRSDSGAPAADKEPASAATAIVDNGSGEHIYTQMAQAILESIPVGPFKSTDCKSTIEQRWPNHPLATTDPAKFGSEFKAKIWPIMKVWGVTIPNAGKQPIRYEMTQDAKGNAQK